MFEFIFLEPKLSDSDLLISAAERRRFNDSNNRSLDGIRPESCGSLNSLNSIYVS